ncbi:hypothetical protein SeMB42_g05080 [Synchytrium endobioticum]|uniref:Tubby C-terminal domain-containing protein n=1 Tax=Synchytrium endobioticum TaxID=286115 RepID=A0A507CTS9_9FUNG|nr:hypothetical protein SeMB42_g05080 [Synchytrium endobioticum]TPX43507.1 hypothetical protein SeLEV6574_g05027 [Synchytrium endobioticum]TPX43508.1 hypothetical protein SeLEV6574_g05024 [Synchytrium endobioticum]
MPSSALPSSSSSSSSASVPDLQGAASSSTLFGSLIRPTTTASAGHNELSGYSSSSSSESSYLDGLGPLPDQQVTTTTTTHDTQPLSIIPPDLNANLRGPLQYYINSTASTPRVPVAPLSTHTGTTSASERNSVRNQAGTTNLNNDNNAHNQHQHLALQPQSIQERTPFHQLEALIMPRHPRQASQPYTPSQIHDILTNPLPQGQKLLCKIIRHKEGVEKMYPSYEVFIESDPASLNGGPNSRTFLMAARKRKKSKTSNYIITSTRLFSSVGGDVPSGGRGAAKMLKRKDIIGKVRSNFLGTAFAVYDNGRSPLFKRSSTSTSDIGGTSSDCLSTGGNVVDSETDLALPVREELASVIYDPNILGLKGPRKMTVLLPGMTRTGERIPIRPTQHSETLLERYRNHNDRETLTLHNKSPQWNEETQSYVLNFNGRVTLASVKNFQIVHDADFDYVILQFGRISESEFTMDFQYPFSAVQAFGIAISSFDAKLACE